MFLFNKAGSRVRFASDFLQFWVGCVYARCLFNLDGDFFG